MTLNEISAKIMDLAKEKNWGTRPEEINTYEKLALAHSELSEALEAYRHRKFEGRDSFKEELADTVVRVIHLAAIYGIDLEKEILQKIEINYGRDWSWKNETHG